MARLEAVVPNMIYLNIDYGKIVVKQGTIPDKAKQNAIVQVAKSRLASYGPVEITPDEGELAYRLEAGNGVWGIQRSVGENEGMTNISFSPFDYRGTTHKTDEDGKIIYGNPKKLITVAYEGLEGAGELYEGVNTAHRGEIQNKVKQILSGAQIADAKIDIDNVTKRNVETSASGHIRTRGAVRYRGESESVDCMLQEFTDTAIDYTETERRREDRYSTSSRECLDEAGEERLRNLVSGLIFGNNGDINKGSILGFGLSFVRIKGQDGIVYRIDQEKGGDVTHLVIESDDGIVPIEFREPRGFRDLFGKISSDVFPVLRKQIADEKRDTTLRRIVENLELMNPPMLATCISLNELLGITKQNPKLVDIDFDVVHDILPGEELPG